MSKDLNDQGGDIASFLGGLIVGGIVGLGIGLLTSPKSGSEVRDDVWESTRKLRHGKTGRFIEKTRFQLENRMERVADRRRANKAAKARRQEDEALGIDYHYVP